MQIDNSLTKVTFSFTPAAYFLVYGKDDRFGSDHKTWSLNPRINMEYAGKDDQVAAPIIYLTDADAEVCKKAGFTYIEYEEQATSPHSKDNE